MSIKNDKVGCWLTLTSMETQSLYHDINLLAELHDTQTLYTMAMVELIKLDFLKDQLQVPWHVVHTLLHVYNHMLDP